MSSYRYLALYIPTSGIVTPAVLSVSASLPTPVVGFQLLTPSPVSVTAAVQVPAASSPEVSLAPQSLSVSVLAPTISNSIPTPDEVAVAVSLRVPTVTVSGKILMPLPVSVALSNVSPADVFLGAKIRPDVVSVVLTTTDPSSSSTDTQIVTPDVLTLTVNPNSTPLAPGAFVFTVNPTATYVELPQLTILQASAIPAVLPIVKATQWIVELVLDDGLGGVSISRVPAESIQITSEWLGDLTDAFVPIGSGSINLTAKFPGLAALDTLNQALIDAAVDSTLLTRPGLIRVFRIKTFHDSDLTVTDGPFVSALITSVAFARNVSGYVATAVSATNLTQALDSYCTHVLSLQDLGSYNGGAGEPFTGTLPVSPDRFVRPRDSVVVTGGFTIRANNVTTTLTARGWSQTVSSTSGISS